MYRRCSDAEQDPLDTSIFTQPYDFHYPLMSTSNPDIGAPAVTMPVGSIDSGISAEGMTVEVVQDRATTQQSQGQNASSTRDGRRSSSEEKDLTPAQSRRKAQNRAA